MELDIWKGDWGLASIDINSLKVATYVKFLGAPIKFIDKCNPLLSPKGTFPILRDGKQIFHEFEEIKEHLRTQNFNADANLTREQEVNSWAYTQYLDHKLYPCLQYIWWADVTNSGQEVRTWYTKNIPFPLNYYYPPKFEQTAKNLMEIIYDEEYDTKEVHLDIYQSAEKCFSDLSTKLGDNDFFFGSHPTSLDATVFAYLALILKIPQKNATLLNTLKTHNNLVQFASRISHRYFPLITNEYASKNSKKATGIQDEDEKNSTQRTRRKIFAGLFATIAMTCYAISKGMLQINLREEFQDPLDYNEYFEMEEEEN